MKLRTFALRNTREILRDPLNLLFGLGFPLVVLLLLSAIQANIPVPLFAIETLAPGVPVFGLSFMTLFAATLLAKDRSSALLQRLYTTPLTAQDYILGYTLPLLPMALGQAAICCLAAAALGLKLTANALLCIPALLPAAVLFISTELLCGSVFSDKQVGGICGALLTNLTAWLSGIWLDVKLVGGWFERIACALPFIHAVELERAVLRGSWSAALSHLWWVAGYAAAVTVLAVWVFTRRMGRA